MFGLTRIGTQLNLQFPGQGFEPEETIPCKFRHDNRMILARIWQANHGYIAITEKGAVHKSKLWSLNTIRNKDCFLPYPIVSTLNTRLFVAM